jgi:hypothetical protein
MDNTNPNPDRCSREQKSSQTFGTCPDERLARVRAELYGDAGPGRGKALGVRLAARPPTIARMTASAWTFGWEALVAIGTLALAGVTLFLVLSTRRLAMQTALEVEAQWRPILVPREDTLRIWEADLTDDQQELLQHIGSEQWVGGDRFVDTAEMQRRHMSVTLRNIGPGPALEVVTSHLWAGQMPWWASSWDKAVLATSQEHDVEMTGFPGVGDGSFRVQYRDLAGRRYTTEIRAYERPAGPKVEHINISDGYWDAEIPRPSMGDPAMFMMPGIRGRARAAANVLFPPLGDPARRPARLWRRLIMAAQAMRLTRSVTVSQRIRYAYGRSRRPLNPEIPRHVPKFLGPVVLPWRRFRYGYMLFRRYRGWG